MVSYKEKYKSVQVNISREKYADLIEWLEQRAIDDATSLNSIIIRAMIKEWKRDGEDKEVQ